MISFRFMIHPAEPRQSQGSPQQGLEIGPSSSRFQAWQAGFRPVKKQNALISIKSKACLAWGAAGGLGTPGEPSRWSDLSWIEIRSLAWGGGGGLLGRIHISGIKSKKKHSPEQTTESVMYLVRSSSSTTRTLEPWVGNHYTLSIRQRSCLLISHIQHVTFEWDHSDPAWENVKICY